MPRRSLAALMAAVLSLSTVAGSARAGLIDTREVLEPAAAACPAAGADRAEVLAALQGWGLSADEARARLEAWAAGDGAGCEGPAAQPAGRGLFGVAVFVVAVLVLTDSLGITRVFPFTRSRR